MKREILINQDTNEIQAAVVEDGRMEEFYIERLDGFRMFGNIYKGRVKTVIRGMGASFVHLGTPKDGFLYVADALRAPVDLEAEPIIDADAPPAPSAREQRRSMRHKRIDEVLKIGQEVIVQIVKEPLGTKGPRLTTHFSIPARYLVMIPGDEKIGISGRIEDKKERDRIRSLFKKLEIPKGVGFIVRTAAEGKSELEFERDIRYLLSTWKRIHKSISSKKAPSLIHQELGLVERIIRDHFVEGDKLVVSSKDLLHKVKRFVAVYLPKTKVDIELYRDHSMFEHYGVAKEIGRTYQKNVYLKSGGYIVIQQTEGLVSIDVNTGKFTGTKDLEETVFKTNVEAAEEVARQMRLRDMGGIIVIDFIDMERSDHRRELFRTFKNAVDRDRAKTNILPISELGLIEMSRQRIRPSHESSTFNHCAYCDGKGVVKSVNTMAIETLRELRKGIGGSKGRIVHVYVNPEVATRVLEHEKKVIQNLERSTGSKIFIFGESSLHVEDVNLTFVK